MGYFDDLKPRGSATGLFDDLVPRRATDARPVPDQETTDAPSFRGRGGFGSVRPGRELEGGELVRSDALGPADPRSIPRPTAFPEPPASPVEPDPFEGEGVGSLAKRRGQQFAQGFGEVAASVPEALAQGERAGQQREKDLAPVMIPRLEGEITGLKDRLRDPGLDPDARTFIEGQIADKQAGLDRMRAAQQAPVADVQDQPSYAGGDAVREWVKAKAGAPDPRDTSFWGQVAGGAGSMVAFVGGTLAGGLIGGPGTGFAAAAGLGGAANEAQIYREARDSGASEQDALRASRMAFWLGTAEAIPIDRALRVLPPKLRGEVSNRLVQRLMRTAQSGGEEALQEAINAIGNNMIASGIYDPDRGITEGVAEQALVGFVLGAGLGAIGQAASRGDSSPDALDSPPIFNPPDDDEPPRPPVPTDAELSRLSPEDLASPVQNDVLARGRAVLDAIDAGQPIPEAAPQQSPETESVRSSAAQRNENKDLPEGDVRGSERYAILDEVEGAPGEGAETGRVVVLDREGGTTRAFETREEAEAFIRPEPGQGFGEPATPDAAGAGDGVGPVSPVPAPVRAPQKRPLAYRLRDVGVRPGTPLAADLNARGINSRTHPGLFKRSGAGAWDNLPASEWADLAPHIGQDGNGYLSEQGLVDALEREMRGDPIYVGEQLERKEAQDAEEALLRLEQDQALQDPLPPLDFDDLSVSIPDPESDIRTPEERRRDIEAAIDGVENALGMSGIFTGEERARMVDELDARGGDVESVLWRQIREDADAAESATEQTRDVPWPDVGSRSEGATLPDAGGPGQSQGFGRPEGQGTPRPDPDQSAPGGTAPRQSGLFDDLIPEAARPQRGDQPGLFADLTTDDGGKAQRDRAEIDARTRQSRSGRLETERVEEDPDTLFGAGRQSDIEEATAPQTRDGYDTSAKAVRQMLLRSKFWKPERVSYTLKVENIVNIDTVDGPSVQGQFRVWTIQSGVRERERWGWQPKNQMSYHSDFGVRDGKLYEEGAFSESGTWTEWKPVSDPEAAWKAKQAESNGDLFETSAIDEVRDDGDKKTTPDTPQQKGAAGKDAQEGPPAAPAPTAAEIDRAARETDPDPTDAQKEAENYKTGKIDWQGLTLSIENRKGSERSGTSQDGSTWSVKMPAHYGRILGTIGADGDHVDFYMGPKPKSNLVFIIDQKDLGTGKFDEHKVMLGFTSAPDARATYDKGFSDGKGPERRDDKSTVMSVASFKDWLENGDTTKPTLPGALEATKKRDELEAREKEAADWLEANGFSGMATDLRRNASDRRRGLRTSSMRGYENVRALEAAGWPIRPNAHGVIDRNKADVHEQLKPAKKSDRSEAQFWAVEIVPGVWDYTVAYSDGNSGSSGPLSVRGREGITTREEAVAAARKALQKTANGKLDSRASTVSDKDRAWARKVLNWLGQPELEAKPVAKPADDALAPRQEITTPGTRIKWANLADWAKGARQLNLRRASSKKYEAQRNHLRLLSEQPRSIFDEASTEDLRAVKEITDHDGDGEFRRPQRGSRGGTPHEPIRQIVSDLLAQRTEPKGTDRPEFGDYGTMSEAEARALAKVILERGDTTSGFERDGTVWEIDSNINTRDRDPRPKGKIFIRPPHALKAYSFRKKDLQERTAPGEASAADVQERTDQEPAKKRRRAASKGLSAEKEARLDEVKAKLAQKLKTQLSAGLDPEIVSLAVEYAALQIEKGARKFRDFLLDMADDFGLAPKVLGRYARLAYNDARDELEAAGEDVSDMDTSRDVIAVLREFNDVPGASSTLERDRGDPAPTDEVGAGDVPAAPGDADAGSGEGRGTSDPGSGEREGGGGLSQGDAAALGGQGAGALPGSARGSGQSSGDRDRGGSRGSDQSGPATDRSGTEYAERHARDASPVKDRRALQKRADAVPVQLADEANIRETLPLLQPAQQDDVLKIERRFAKPDGHGMLITNGTGTGKTYTGGGVVKRFVQQGKENILILAPSQGILDGWISVLEDLGVPASKLADTKTAGQGVVATTYANAGENSALTNREWDLIIPDEAHELSSNAAGDPTAALNTLRGISHHPGHLWQKTRLRHSADWKALSKMKDGEPKAARGRMLHERERQEVEEFGKLDRSKVLFLSATPFAYDKSVDYAEGYLFDYGPAGVTESGSRQGGRELFMVSNFGYRIRYHKLTKPEAAVDTGVFEREFHERLKREGMLSGRSLDIDADYDRKFSLVHDSVGHDIDAVQEFIWKNMREAKGVGKAPWEALEKQTRMKWHHKMQFLEQIKARAAIPDIRAHLELGRKVVVFHDFNKGGNISFLRDVGEGEPAYDAYSAVLEEFPQVADWDFSSYKSPREAILEEFGDRAAEYNGTVSKKERAANLARFNEDGSELDVLVIQSQAGSAGLSAHDVTGGHQRVLINLGMPVRPTTALQEEGRIRRVGSISDAPFRYYTIGTTWERSAFAAGIAEKSGTVENLALGAEARAIRDSFVEAYEEAEPLTPSADDGKGGKDRDRAHNLTSPYEIAKTHYFGRTKNTQKRENRAGIDFFATPEPLGFKMVEWARVGVYEKVLEPSAGDGAIARYFPDHADRTVVEPSAELLSRAQLRVTGARTENTRFEDLHVVNKYHAIVMNPPFGSGGKTAVEHVSKAAKHLKDGGRIVALIPTGPAADKRFNDWFFDNPDTQDLSLTGEYQLPGVTFEKAGTSVRARIVIIDKVTDPDARADMAGQRVRADLSGASDIGEFFNRLEDLHGPERAPQLTPADPFEDAEAAQAEDEAAASATPVVVGGFTTLEGSHPRSGDPLYVARFAERVERPIFDAARQVAKKHGGYYYGRGKTPGFTFGTEESRKAFVDEMSAPVVSKDQRLSDTFFSPLLRALEGAKQKQATAKDWKAIIAKFDGVKRAEVEWLGIEEWLDSLGAGQIPRELVVKYARANEIVIDEAVRAGEYEEPYIKISVGDTVWPDDWSDEAEGWMDEAREQLLEEEVDRWSDDGEEGPRPTEDDLDPALVQELAEKIAEERYEPQEAFAHLYDDAIYSDGYEGPEFEGYFDIDTRDYYFPGLAEAAGKTDEGNIDEATALAWASEASENQWGQKSGVIGEALHETFTEPGGDNYREILLRIPGLHESGKNEGQVKRPFIEGNHFPEANIVVHSRVKDRLDGEDKPVLFVEEIQSDLATVWREQQESPETTQRREELTRELEALRDTMDEAWSAMQDAWEDVARRPAFKEAPTNKIAIGEVLGEVRPSDPELFEREDVKRFALVLEDHPSFGEAVERRAEAIKRFDETNAELLRLGTKKTAPPSTPDTPFKQEATYTLMVKRLLRIAAEKGYHKLSWTPGYMQAERWSKAGQSVVEAVKWEANGEYFALQDATIGEDETFHRAVDLTMQGGRQVMVYADENGDIAKATGPFSAAHDLAGQSLSRLLGPGLAKEILAKETGSVSGQKITFASSGYAVAYDQQIKRAVDRLAKKHGSKVEVDTGLDFAESDPVWSIEITDSLREAAMRPQAMFQNRGPEFAREVQYRSTLKDILPELRSELDRLHLKRVSLEADTGIDGARRGGAFTVNRMGEMKILLSQGARGPDGYFHSLHHEAIHALRAMNLFTPAEWAALEAEAVRTWVERHNIPQRYPDLLPSEQIEEAIAEAFADWAQAERKAKGPVAGAFAKVRRFFNAVMSVLSGKGYDTPEKIFGRALAGEVGARTPGGIANPIVREQRARAARRPATKQAAAHRRAAVSSSPFIPDRGVWDEFWRNNTGIWGRLQGAGQAAYDRVDRARILFQDRFLPVLRAQEAIIQSTGAAIPENQNAYLAELQFSGKVGRHLFEIDEDFVKPIIDAIAETRGRLTADDVGTWLYARHAKERNARIADINPAMADGGSGMTDGEADAILAAAAAGPDAGRLLHIGRLVDELRERTLRLREESGLIDSTEADIWRSQYKSYVPLKGFAETDHSEATLDITGVGRRYSVRGGESRQALGRRSEAFNPLVGAITQAQEVAVRAEKNRVGAALYDLVKENPAPAMWEVKSHKQKRYFNRTTGMVETRVENPLSLILKPNEMAVKIGGKEKRIIWKDERLARAAGSVGADQMNWFIQMMSAASRWFSAVNTMLDPEFVIRNAVRDMTAAQINLRNFGGDDRNALAKAIIKNWPKAFAGAYRGQRNKADSEWTRYYREFEEAGAKVSFWRLDQPEAGSLDLEHRIKLAGGSIAQRASKLVRVSTRDNPILGFIERTNLAVDNAIRLAAFVEARKRGWSKQDAAALAKDMTVNFNRRGEWGATINALYPFANAGLQGTQIMFRALTSRRMAKYVVGMVVLGGILDQVNAWWSEEDEDGELAYDKIPDWKNRINLTVMLGPGAENAATLWMPYGYSLFPYLGQQISKVARGVKPAGRALGDLAAASMEHFSPVGGFEFSGDGWSDFQRLLTPTVLDPVNEMAMNEDWLGRPIRPENAYADYGPDAYKFYGGASTASRAAADAMNRATGGNQAEAGWVDVSPEYLDHAAGFLLGGAGRFWGRSTDLFAKAVSKEGDQIEFRDIPFLRSLRYETGDWLDRDRYYRFRDQVREAKAAAKVYTEAGEPVPDRVAILADLDANVKAVEKRLRETRSQKRQIQENDRLSPGDRRALRERVSGAERNVFLSFNSLFLEAMGPQGE